MPQSTDICEARGGLVYTDRGARNQLFHGLVNNLLVLALDCVLDEPGPVIIQPGSSRIVGMRFGPALQLEDVVTKAGLNDRADVARPQ